MGRGSFWNRPYDTTVRLDQPLERGNKAAYRDQVAEAGAQAAKWDVVDVERQQRIAVAQAYWDLKCAQDQLHLAQANWSIARESSQAALVRLASGDLSRLEATRLAVEEGRAANEQAQARTQAEQARLALGQSLQSQQVVWYYCKCHLHLPEPVVQPFHRLQE